MSSSLDTGIIEVEFSDERELLAFSLNCDMAQDLRDMLNDALVHMRRARGHVTPNSPLPCGAMSPRLGNILYRERIKTYNDLAQLTAVDLMDMRGFGVACLREVIEILLVAGFSVPQFAVEYLR